MKIASSRAMTAALVFASTVVTTQAQEAIAPLCRSIDYAFADQERDYYAFYAFDRNYTTANARMACGAVLVQELASKQ